MSSKVAPSSLSEDTDEHNDDDDTKVRESKTNEDVRRPRPHASVVRRRLSAVAYGTTDLLRYLTMRGAEIPPDSSLGDEN